MSTPDRYRSAGLTSITHDFYTGGPPQPEKRSMNVGRKGERVEDKAGIRVVD